MVKVVRRGCGGRTSLITRMLGYCVVGVVVVGGGG